MAGVNLGVLAMALGMMAPQPDEMKQKLDRALETGSLEEFHKAIDRMERPTSLGVDFGVRRAHATPQTGVHSEVVRSSDARPKGRGQRRREAAARKGKK